MTFSQKVKEEICDHKLVCPACRKSFVLGALFNEQLEGAGQMLFRSDYVESVQLLAELIVEECGVVATVHSGTKKAGKKHTSFGLSVDDPTDHQCFLACYDWLSVPDLSTSFFTKACCCQSFARGLFLGCGVIVNPEREYHLEFKIHRADQADKLCAWFHQKGFLLKQTQRKGVSVLYLKGSDAIEEILAFLGAYNSAMELMNIRIMKELRNHANRATNCETANIQKTVNASTRQCADIEYLLREKGESFLPEELREVARVRLQYPEYSLQELCDQLSVPMSRSGMSRRLKKLTELAGQVKKKQ